MIDKQTHLYSTAIDFDLVDAGNVVYHPNYLILCERARVRALTDAGYPFEQLLSEGTAFAIAECHCRYFKPLLFGQKISILSVLVESSATRLIVRQEIVYPLILGELAGFSGFHPSTIPLERKDVIFQADLTLVSVTLNPLKPTRIPLKLNQAFGL